MGGVHRLIVAEKPSVGRDIARVVGATRRGDGFLEGPGVRVSWCVGHLAQLCEPHEYDPAWKSWSPALLPLLPEMFRIRASKHGAKQLRVLRGLLRDKALTEVINACDAGREGELIFRYVYQLTRAKAPVRRLWISSLTEPAIRTGLARVRGGDDFDALADAARCRAEADWLVGMNGTRALTGLARRAGGDVLMSVGRVQTPTLALIVRREDAIEAFVSRPFWQVDATFSSAAGSYGGRWHRAIGKTDDADSVDRTRLLERADAEVIAAATKNSRGRVAVAKQRRVREQPPRLYDLTALQKTANQRFGMTAQQTLTIAQALYEKHKVITYPRTDSRHLTTDMVPGLNAVVKSLSAAFPALSRAAQERLSLASVPGRRMVDDSCVGDHHAIIPTGKAVDMSRLNTSEARIFELIARRFIAGLLPDAVFAKTRIETVVAEHLYVSDGRVCLDAGWQAAEPPASRKKRKQEAPLLPAVRVGDAANVTGVKLHEGKTEAPKRFADATLLGAMERAHTTVDDDALRRALRDKGLGTPATRAAIIENLIRRSYVQRVKHSLQPTAHGRALIAVMPVEALLSAELTGMWENKLAQVARGDLDRSAFMSELRIFVTQIVDTIAGADSSALIGLAALPKRESARKSKRLRNNRKLASPKKPAVRNLPSAPSRAPSSAKPANSRRAPRCPACKMGAIIAGHHAWGCSRWQQSCEFVVAFVQRGVRVPADEAERLFRRGQTRLMSGLSPHGKARLVLDLSCADNVHVELGKRRSKPTRLPKS